MNLVSIFAVQLLGLVVLLLGFVAAAKRRRLYAVLHAGLILYQALCLPALPYYVDLFGTDVVGKGVLIALAGILVLELTIETLESMFSRDKDVRIHAFVEEVTADPQLYTFIAVSAFGIVGLITFSRGIALLESNWETMRAGLGFLDSIANLLQFVAFPACWVMFRLGRRGIALIFFLFAIAIFAANGSRAALLTIPAVIGLDVYSRGLFFTRRYAVGGGLFLLLFVLIVHVGGRFIRGWGLGGLVSLMQGDLSPLWAAIVDPEPVDWSGGESGINHSYFFVIKEGIIEGVDSLSTVFRWITIYLPRSLAPDFKPIDPTYSLWVHSVNAGLFDGETFHDRLMSLLRQGEMGSAHALYWGEAWMNGGVFALATMSVGIGTIVFLLDRFFLSLPATVMTLLGPATAVGYLMVARGNSVIGLGYIAYLTPPALVAYSMLSLLREQRVPGYHNSSDRGSYAPARPDSPGG